MMHLFQIREEKFSKHGDYMYYFSGTSKKYLEAQTFCSRVHAFLVEFYDRTQYDQVITVYK
jgi:hypothetical protein